MPMVKLNANDIEKVLGELRVLDSGPAELLAALAPEGDIVQFNFGLDKLGEKQQFFVCGQFKDFGLKPWRRYPGVESLSGRVCGGKDSGGLLQLEGIDTQLELPHLIRYPLEFEKIEGQLAWSRTSTGWSINTASLEAVTADISTRSRISLDIGDEPVLNMQVAFANANGPRLHRYMPATVLDPELP